MCRFKSGIILKNKCVIAQADNDSHSELLIELKIEDTSENAMRKFVRAELVPVNDEWWTDPDAWEFTVDQDIVPEWFENDKGRYENEFREAVKDWWKEHVLIDQKIEELSTGYYRLKRCEVKRLRNDVKVVLGSSTVQNMLDSSTVQKMYGSSTVQAMCGSSLARDYSNNVLHVSKDMNLEIVKHKNKGSE